MKSEKMIKRAAAISAVFIFAGVSADAADLKFYESVMKNGEYSFVVEGYAPSLLKDKDVNIMIFNPGYDIEDGKNIFPGEYLQYQAYTTTSEGGYFKIEAPIYLDGINDSGEYTCYVGGEAFSGSEKLSVYFASIEDRKNAIEMIKNSVNTAELLINLKEGEKYLSLSDGLYNAVDKEKLAGLIFGNKETLNAENPAESTRIIRSVALLEAYNEGLKEYAVSGTEFINKELIDFSHVDKNGADFYSKGYSEILSAEGKNNLINSLMKKNYKTTDDLLKNFKESVVIFGIKYSVSGGTGHIDALLTKENADESGLNIPIYLSITSDAVRTKANEAILKANFNDKQSLENAIETAAKAAKDSQGQGGGNKNGGSASANGNYTQVVIGNNNVNINQNVVDNEALNKEVFSDLGEAEWAKEAILYLYDKNIVSGVGNDRFAPQSNVTREQFVVMIMRAFNIEAELTDSGFFDVLSGVYYEKYIASAKNIGLVKGISEDEFGVGKMLSRQDLAVMVKNAAEFAGKTLDEKKESVSFADRDTISDYAKAAVLDLARAGVINGFSDNTFRPKNNCTRAQAAKIIYELVKGADE